MSIQNSELSSLELEQSKDINVVVTHILKEFLMKFQMMREPDKLDPLIAVTTENITKVNKRQKDLLTEHEVVERFPFLNVNKLRNMRARSQGPSYHKFGSSRNSRVFYRMADIESWILSSHQKIKNL